MEYERRPAGSSLQPTGMLPEPGREKGAMRAKRGARLGAFFGLFTLACVLGIATRVGQEDGRAMVIGGLSHIPLEAVGMAVAWQVSRRSPGSFTARAWRLIAVALGLWLIGDVLLGYFEVVQSEDAFPSAADIAFLAFYPCLAAGLLSIPSDPRDRTVRRNLALDAVIVLLGASMVIWYIIVRPELRPENPGPVALALSAAYQAGDLILLFGVAVILLRRPRYEPALVLLLAGVAFVVVADIGYTGLSLRDNFDRGDWPDAGWLMGEYLFLLAALVQLKGQGDEPVPAALGSPSQNSRLPYVAVVVGYALLLTVGWQTGQSRLNGLLIGAAALTVAVLVRQLLVLRENVRLSEQQSRLAAIVESSDEAIIASTLDGTIMDWNPGAERMYGYLGKDVVGSQPIFLCRPGQAHELTEALQRVARGEVHRYETVRVRQDGSLVDVLITAFPIRDASGKVVRASEIGRDITERRRMEASRDEFIANAAHELRTPLATLTFLGEILTERLHDMTPKQLARSLVALERQGRRANVLIANLLDLSQLQGGRMQLAIEPVKVVHAAKHALEAALPPGSTTVWIEVASDLEVMTDAMRLEQVITNLLTNAYRYGGDYVVVEGDRDGDDVIVSVSDDGQGVSPDLEPRLFEPFTRDLTADYQGGSGIGLALCRRLVEALGGEIAYERAVPTGSRFTVRLPGA